jgi:hypothetical protein
MELSLSGVRPGLTRDRKIVSYDNFSPVRREIQGESAPGMMA